MNIKAMKPRSEKLILLSILAVGIIMRIIKFGDPAIVMDTVAFSRLGLNLIEHGRYVFGENYNMGVFFPPGYPFFIGIANIFSDDLFFSAKLVSFIASCITIILAYLISKEIYDKEAGLFAAFIFAVYPTLLIISVDSYADSLFFCFLLLTIYIFLLSLKTDKIYIHILFAIALSASFLTRPEALFLFVLPGMQIFGFFNRKSAFQKSYVLKVVLISVIFILFISPYMIVIKNYTGKFSISGKANVSMILGELSDDKEYHEVVNAPDNLYDRAAFSLNVDKTELKGWGKNINRSLSEYLLKDPGKLLKRYLKNILREVKILNKLMIPIIIPLFFVFFRRDLFKNRVRLIFLSFPLLFFFLYPGFIIIEKQTLFIIVFLGIFSSGGFSNAGETVSDIAKYYGIADSFPSVFLRKNIKIIILLLMMLSSLLYLKYSGFVNVSMPVEHQKAGIYLKEHVSAEYERLNVMARKPYVNFYSGTRFTMIPYADVNDVINFAKLHNVDYIVIDERSLGKWDYYYKLNFMHRYSDDVVLFYEDNQGMPIKLFKVNK